VPPNTVTTDWLSTASESVISCPNAGTTVRFPRGRGRSAPLPGTRPRPGPGG
jgi:hypothetical protein